MTRKILLALLLSAGLVSISVQNRYRAHGNPVFSHKFTCDPAPLKSTDFSWNVTNDAWAAHVTERNGRYYYYISTSGAGIGVAVSDRPEGPYKDALGKPLLTKEDCEGADHGRVCIDPAVFIDDDGQAYIFWGNKYCYYARLKENMIEIDGEITRLQFDERWPFTEAAWVHKANGKYYLITAPSSLEQVTAVRCAWKRRRGSKTIIWQ